MSHRSYLSGAQKRKLAIEKKERTSAVLEKPRKVTHFFQRNETTPNSSNDQDPDPRCESRELNQADFLDTAHVVPVNSTSPNHSFGDGNLHGEQRAEILNRSTDPGKWEKLTSEDIEFWVKRGPSTCQNSNGPFESSKRRYESESTSRYCPQNVFFGTRPNGEKTNRDWLIYSQTLFMILSIIY